MATPGAGKYPILTSALFASLTIIFGYKWFISPVLTRRQRDRQEELAEQVYSFTRKDVDAPPGSQKS